MEGVGAGEAGRVDYGWSGIYYNRPRGLPAIRDRHAETGRVALPPKESPCVAPTLVRNIGDEINYFNIQTGYSLCLAG